MLFLHSSWWSWVACLPLACLSSSCDPTAWATYHVLYLPPLNDNTTYIIQGVFPRVR